MAIDLSGLSESANAIQSLSNLILVTPEQKGYRTQNADGSLSDSVLFTYEKENEVDLESDITDHFTEDNTTIQDQIALKPEMITVGGVIGELTTEVPRALQLAREAAEKLVAIDAYLPELSTQALRSYQRAEQAYFFARQLERNKNQFLDQAFGQEERSQSKQQILFQRFYAAWRGRKLFTVQTPWAIFKNCAIQSLKSRQDEETQEMTDFEIVFKVMRFAETQFVEAGESKADRLREQVSSTANKGSQAGLEVDLQVSDL